MLTVQRSTAEGTPAFNIFNVFFATQGHPVSISGLTISNGKGSLGGGILNTMGSLTLTNCIISGNTATSGGGGVFNNTGPLTLINCTLSGNTVTNGNGGGIAIGDSSSDPGTLTATNCTFSGNTASSVDTTF